MNTKDLTIRELIDGLNKIDFLVAKLADDGILDITFQDELIFEVSIYAEDLWDMYSVLSYQEVADFVPKRVRIEISKLLVYFMTTDTKKRGIVTDIE